MHHQVLLRCVLMVCWSGFSIQQVQPQDLNQVQSARIVVYFVDRIQPPTMFTSGSNSTHQTEQSDLSHLSDVSTSSASASHEKDVFVSDENDEKDQNDQNDSKDKLQTNKQISSDIEIEQGKGKGKATKTASETDDKKKETQSSASNGNDSNDSMRRGYKCNCRQLRKVSLLGASDYCLSPYASIADKCGNSGVKEQGECPRVGAEPCSAAGLVLTDDSFCELDARDQVYKCVASKDDVAMQKDNRRKNKQRRNQYGNTATSASDDGEAQDASSNQAKTRKGVLGNLLLAFLCVFLPFISS